VITVATTKKSTKSRNDGNEVDDFMKKLDHPLKSALQEVRSIILGANPKIREGIKWNAPSFATTEYFATVNIRKEVVLVILHFGAKVKDNSLPGLTIKDPSELLEWLAKDRAAVTFRDLKAVKTNRAAFAKIVRQWIANMP
jgi:hypothetical protein